jgi:hypothetical protein
LKPIPKRQRHIKPKEDANGYEYLWDFRTETVQEEGKELNEYDFSSYELKMAFVHCNEEIFR